MRNLAMILSLAAAYVLLRGHPEGWPAVMRACLAVLVLVAGIGIWGRRGRGEGEVVASRRSAGWLDYLAIGAAVLSLECLFLVFFATVPEPMESAAFRIEEWLRPERAAARRQALGPGDTNRQGNWLWDDEGRRPLPLRTNYRQGNRPEIFLQPSGVGDAERMIDSRLYVQAFALSRYEDAVWQAYPDEGKELVAATDGWLRLPVERRGATVACRVFQGNEENGQNPLTGLQGLTAARVPEVVKRDEGLYLLPEQDEGFDYDTISRPVTVDDLEAGRLEPSKDVPQAWLDLPGGSLGSRIFLQTEVVAGSGDLKEKLVRIRNHLRTTLEYSLVTENANDLDPLENFMFHEQRGHCEFYATAGALMARAAGIPSRVAYGWVGGTYYEGSRLFVFRSREAHAWTEVWIKDYGWVVLDPTPPAALARAETERADEDEAPPGTDDLEKMVVDDPFAERPVWKVGLVLACVFGLPGFGMLLWRALKKEDGGASGSGNREVGRAAGYLDPFVDACRRRGLRVSPGVTLRALIERLDEPPEFAEELASYHYGVRYEGKSPDTGKEKALRRRVELWN